MAERLLDTSKRFGFEWHRHRSFFPHYEQQFRGWIAPLGPESFAGRDELDAGCGMGRNSYWAVRYGARSLVAVDQAELAVAAAREVLADLPGACVERASLYALAHPVSVPHFLLLKLAWLRTEYAAQVRRFPFAHLHKIVFDQLLPEIARYYRRAEVEQLFAGLDVSRVEIHHNRGYSWTVLCEK